MSYIYLQLFTTSVYKEDQKHYILSLHVSIYRRALYVKLLLWKLFQQNVKVTRYKIKVGFMSVLIYKKEL